MESARNVPRQLAHFLRASAKTVRDVAGPIGGPDEALRFFEALATLDHVAAELETMRLAPDPDTPNQNPHA